MQKETEDKKQSQSSSFIWDAEKKRPSNFVFITVIALTILFIIWGTPDTLNKTHEIKVIIDYSGSYDGELIYNDNYESLDESGYKEFTFIILEGSYVEVYVYRPSSSTEPLTVSIYDNDELVA